MQLAQWQDKKSLVNSRKVTIKFNKVLSNVIAISLIIAGIGCQSGSQESLLDKPSITLISPSRSLKEIRIGSHTEIFQVSNSGAGMLRITRLERSCTCTEVSIDKDSLVPGESTNIRVTITPKESEERSTAVYVHSNDTEHPKMRIALDWMARGAVTATPELINFGIVRPKQTVCRELVVRRQLSEIPASCKTTMTIVPSELVQARLKRSVEQQGMIIETWELTVSPVVVSDEQSGRVLLKFDGSQQGGVSVPLIWSARDSVLVSPKRLFLGTSKSASRVVKLIDVRAEPGQLLKIVRMRCTNDKLQITTRLVEVNSNNFQVEVAATFPEDEGSHVGELIIECESPEVISLRVPLALAVKNVP